MLFWREMPCCTCRVTIWRARYVHQAKRMPLPDALHHFHIHGVVEHGFKQAFPIACCTVAPREGGELPPQLPAWGTRTRKTWYTVRHPEHASPDFAHLPWQQSLPRCLTMRHCAGHPQSGTGATPQPRAGCGLSAAACTPACSRKNASRLRSHQRHFARGHGVGLGV